MKVTFDWKNMTDEFPEADRDIIARLRVEGSIVWFIGVYSKSCILVHDHSLRHVFNGSKFNPNYFTKGHRRNYLISKDDFEYSNWDYYETKWEMPSMRSTIEDLFYK